MAKVEDPNYCRYHQVISHPVEKCIILKELIFKLAKEGKIELDLDEIAQLNHVAITTNQCNQINIISSYHINVKEANDSEEIK